MIAVPENSRNQEGGEGVHIPPLVSFTSGARLLVDLGIVPSITREGVRYAERDPAWPFGEGRPHDYVVIERAKLMPTGPFLDYWRARGKKGRGPNREKP